MHELITPLAMARKATAPTQNQVFRALDLFSWQSCCCQPTRSELGSMSGRKHAVRPVQIAVINQRGYAT
jgi:hypothetical protein